MKRFSLAAAACVFFSTLLPIAANAGWFEQVGVLRPEEVSFIRIVFDGDEAKAVAFAQANRINPDSLAGQPLSGWFYGWPAGGGRRYTDINVQRIVFGTFRQNPNPRNVGISDVTGFCELSPSFKWNTEIAQKGTPEEKQAQSDRWRTEWTGLHASMARGFQSLLRYGLRDRVIITSMFQGCFFGHMPSAGRERYDVVLRPMIKAGADINLRHPINTSPLDLAVAIMDPETAQKLLDDGAKADQLIYSFGRQNQADDAQCLPRLERSIYRHLFQKQFWADKDKFLAMVKLLAKAGLSPLKEYGSKSEFGFDKQCHRTGLYEEIAKVDATLAKAVLEAAVPPPAGANAQLAGPVQPGALVQTAERVTPSRFGFWNVIAGKDGRPVATSKSENGTDFALRELRIECVAGGRLEYVPVPAKQDAVRSILINTSEDAQSELPLVNGRLSGKTAAQLSKQLLKEDSAARMQGAQDVWTMPLVVNDANSPPTMIGGAGFTQARAYLLSHCKS